MDDEQSTQSTNVPYDRLYVRSYKRRAYKQKWARATGWIQVICGGVSIACSVVTSCLYLNQEHIGETIIYCGGLFFVIAGLLGAISQSQSRCMIISSMILSIFSAFLGSIGMCMAIIEASILGQSCYDQCPKSEDLVIVVYGINSVSACFGCLTAIVGSAFCCHGVCCITDDVIPLSNVASDDEAALTNSSNTFSSSRNSTRRDMTSRREGSLDGDQGDTTDKAVAFEFTIVKQIGHGGFSEVFQARWNGQDVAAKRLHEENKREAEVLSKLVHPNIVKLLGVLDEQFNFYLILELCERGSLRSYLDEIRGQRLGQLFYEWAKQAARPIKYLKDQNIVHKDIKSPNYLIANGNVLKLCDFGLAKDMELTISRATETASYHWMAPELLRDNILSPSYDVYAYGVVLWELWTTDQPFEDVKEPMHLVWKICKQNERPEIPDDCPKVVAELMRKCWQTDWKKRPAMKRVLALLSSAEEEAICTS